MGREAEAPGAVCGAPPRYLRPSEDFHAKTPTACTLKKINENKRFSLDALVPRLAYAGVSERGKSSGLCNCAHRLDASRAADSSPTDLPRASALCLTDYSLRRSILSERNLRVHTSRFDPPRVLDPHAEHKEQERPVQKETPLEPQLAPWRAP